MYSYTFNAISGVSEAVMIYTNVNIHILLHGSYFVSRQVHGNILWTPLMIYREQSEFSKRDTVFHYIAYFKLLFARLIHHAPYRLIHHAP